MKMDKIQENNPTDDMDSTEDSQNLHLIQKQEELSEQLDISSSKFKAVLSRMGIYGVKIEDWIILQRSRFETIVDGEPYSALQLYYNSQNGQYIIRVWGKTHTTGRIENNCVGEIESLCKTIFAQGMACCPGHIGNCAEDAEYLVPVDYPFQRILSPNCAIFYLPQGPRDQVPVDICPQCTADTKAKIRIKEERPDTYDSVLKEPLTFYPKIEMEETKNLEEELTKFGNKKRKRNVENLKILTCDLCSYTTKHPYSMKAHVKAVHRKIRDHQCTECDYAASQKYDLKVHMINVHKMDEKQLPDTVISYKTTELKKSNDPDVCHICGHEGTRSSIHQHMHKHKLEENPLRCPHARCGALFSTEEETKKHVHDAHLRRQKFYCEVCGLLCTNKGRLRNHVLSVHKKVSLDIKCTECDEIFVNSSSMQRHRIRVHRPDLFKCNDCNKSFASSRELKRHNNTHTGEKPFQCSQCGQRLGKKEDLEDHMRTHTGEKPFACQYCLYKGSSKSLLYHHKKQVHKAEFAEEKRLKEEAKVKVSVKNDRAGEDLSVGNYDQSSSSQDQGTSSQHQSASNQDLSLTNLSQSTSGQDQSTIRALLQFSQELNKRNSHIDGMETENNYS